jgi:tetratricopeptide (TPR) repeat protein
MKQNIRKPQLQQKNKTIAKNKFTIPAKKNKFDLFLVISVCFPILLYLQTAGFKFTYFDDDRIIINNIPFLSHLGNVFPAFLTDAFMLKMSSFYRPLQTVSYIVDMQLSGTGSAWMFHVSNILLLGLISGLLFLLLKRFSIPPRLALLAALIYCVHPLFISSVAWIPARGDLLLTLFSLLSFMFFIEFLQNRKLLFLLLNWLAFTIALFCKETAAFLPFIFIIYYFTYSTNKRLEKKQLFIILLYAVSGLCWYWLRSKATSGANQNEILGLGAMLSNLRTFPESLAQFFVPVDIAPIPSFSVFKTFIGLLVIALLVYFFFRNKAKLKKEKIFCLSWFLILMLPPMLFKHPLIDYLDHRFFLPLIGILLFVLFLFPKKWFVKGDIKHAWLMIAVLVLLSSFTFIKSDTYSNTLTFYDSAISHNSNCALAYYNRANLKNNNGDFKGAIIDFDKTLAICPDYSDVYNNRAYAKVNLGDKQGALADFDKAIAISPTPYMCYCGRGNVKKTMNDIKGAISDFNKAISVNPNEGEAYNDRGVANYTSNNYKDAIADFNKVISIDPKNADAYNSKGLVMGMMGNYKEAIINFDKAIEINPQFAKAYSNRALAKHSLNDLNGALEDCESALQINPNDKRALNIQAVTRQELQKEGR